MTINRSTLLAMVVAFAAGWWFSGSSDAPPAPDRPVMRWLAKAAKNFLWLALLAEPPPENVGDERRLVQSPAIGDDGYPLLDNARSF